MSPVRTVGLADISLRSLVNLHSPAHTSVASLARALRALDKIGLRCIEPWGGMTVDHVLGELGEDPWDRLASVSKHVVDTPLRLCLRGRCLLGFRPYPWPVVEHFLHRAVDSGISWFLITEPLNDAEALGRLTTMVREPGARLSLTLAHPGDDVCDDACTARLAAQLAGLGPDSLCLRMPRGVTHDSAACLVAAARRVVSMPLEVDFDNGNGLAVLAVLAAIDAGANVVHVSAAPRLLDASALPVGQLLGALRPTGAEAPVDFDAVVSAVEALSSLGSGGEAAQMASADLQTALAATDFRRLTEVPGALVTQLGKRLLEHGGVSRLPEVLSEVGRVCAEVGRPPLVAPVGQIVGTQAVLNTVYGARWQVIPDEMKALLRGEYGTPPVAPAAEIVEALLGLPDAYVDTSSETAPEPGCASETSAGSVSDADALLLALAPATAPAFLAKREAAREVDLSLLPLSHEERRGWEDQWRDFGPDRVRDLVALLEASSVDELTVESGDTKVTVRRSAAGVGVSPSTAGPAVPSPSAMAAADTAGPEAGADESRPPDADLPEGRIIIRASMVGTFYRASAPGADPFVEVGSRVERGDVLCVLEAMKLMNELVAETSGTIAAILVSDGTAVEYGQPLFLLDTTVDTAG